MAFENRDSILGRIVLIIGGGIAAYKSLDLVRHLSRRGYQIDCVMTEGAKNFVQPLSFASLSGNKVRTSLFDESEEAEMDHIALSRRADLILVAPATAHIIARMASGLADDLATTLLLATDSAVMLAPAMNWRMWSHKATRRNIELLKRDGVCIIEPDVGEMACGEYGAGRFPDPEIIADKAIAVIEKNARRAVWHPLAKKTILITSGATHEMIDPVRYIANRSSGKQGHAIAQHLSDLGAKVILISGETEIAPPQNVIYEQAKSAHAMLAACEYHLEHQEIDVACCVAAICDWRIKPSSQKVKKQERALPDWVWEQNPDILARIASCDRRPKLVIGFAAETENVLTNARKKRIAKRCDWMIANDVSENVFGTDHNKAILISDKEEIVFPEMTKVLLAEKLGEHLLRYFSLSLDERV